MGEVVLEQTGGLFCQFIIQIVQIHACLLSEDKELDRTLPCSILGKSLHGGKTALFPYLFNMGYQNKIIFCNLFYVFILLSLTFHVNVIAKKSFLLCFVLAILFSSSCFLKILICINNHEGSEQ